MLEASGVEYVFFSFHDIFGEERYIQEEAGLTGLAPPLLFSCAWCPPLQENVFCPILLYVC